MTEGQLTWGEVFRARINRVPGRMAGLLRCTKPIRRGYTLRNPGSYGKLTSRETRPEAGSTDYMRAWIIAVAAGIDIAEVELSDDELPTGYSAAEWRRLIQEHCPTARPATERKKRR